MLQLIDMKNSFLGNEVKGLDFVRFGKKRDALIFEGGIVPWKSEYGRCIGLRAMWSLYRTE